MRLGPITGATLIVRDLKRALAAYVDELGLQLGDQGRLPRQRGLDMGDAALVDAPCAQLHSTDAAEPPWLTLIEVSGALPGAALARRGWMALGLAVADLDGVVARACGGLWRALDGSIDNTVDAALRAVAVAGPDGEVLYLHQAHGPMSLLPARSGAPVRLHSAVLGVGDRDRALGYYEGLGLVARWRLSARLPAPDHPLAIAQLRGDHLIEIHALPSLPAADAALRSGIRMLSFARSTAAGRRLSASDDPSARILAGAEGEAIELV